MTDADLVSGSGKLAPYQRKRDFARTPEPAGTPEPPGDRPDGSAPRFVVQLHRARRPHYDVRFEIDGVLASWAVPKGPTLDPGVKRIAVHVEDHPIEYLDFEGVIPSGQYGGGDVIVWDRGTWEPHGTDDPAAAVAAGELHADVHGHKLRGRLVLVRRGRDRSDKDQWLLVHKRDQYAVQGWDPADYPLSVLSGRSNDEVKADPRRLWRSDLPPAQASVPVDGAAAACGPSDDELDALSRLGRVGVWEVFGRELRLTNLDKVLFPATDGQPPVTKRELIRYAACVAPVVLPYLTGRALNMHRFPDGVDGGGFWHKQLPDHAPEWINRWENSDADPGETHTYLVASEPATLVWMANFGALEWHAWTSCTDQPHLPSYALIDIDPGPATSWEDVLVLARLHRIALQHLDVTGAPKLTGRRGIQIWIPVARGPSFDETRNWTEQLSRAVGAAVPELVSWEWNVRDRGGKARLDFTQNVINKTLVAPYSPRAAAGAPVSAPIEWDELDDPSLRPGSFTIRDFPRRLTERGDLFQTALTARQVLPPIRLRKAGVERGPAGVSAEISAALMIPMPLVSVPPVRLRRPDLGDEAGDSGGAGRVVFDADMVGDLSDQPQSVTVRARPRCRVAGTAAASGAVVADLAVQQARAGPHPQPSPAAAVADRVGGQLVNRSDDMVNPRLGQSGRGRGLRHRGPNRMQ